MSKDEMKKKLINLLCEEETVRKEENPIHEIIFWTTCGTILTTVNATGHMYTVKSVAATICFGLLGSEVIDAIKTGTLVREFKNIKNKQYRRVK